ncbi:MAG: ferritin-like domain-containing protein [Alphaproteobacteria bacterium]|nr:ferritin-like domain-containing protein [Alphaproteobacteria bacterium]MBV9370814.1 ferritin-like domain-containing protein [Alphaproteobacteria bacterium]MBV9900106.1 ferritin-like domain-containing protein [Alphaproteobacteria bacterium]
MAALLARLVNPVVWRIPGHGARKLFGFSLAEHGSMLDLASAAHLAPDEGRRALYLRHMLDEARHAKMFALRSGELRLDQGKQSLGFPVADNEDLFVRLGELRFLAFVHRGEKRGRQQFEAYREWFGQRGDRKTRALFDAIIRDEVRHETYTYELLVQLAGGRERASAEIRAAGLWEKWRIWRRLGRFLAEKLYFLVMLLVYLVSGPFVLLASRLRPAAKGWVDHQASHVAEPPAAPAAPASLEWTGA